MQSYINDKTPHSKKKRTGKNIIWIRRGKEGSEKDNWKKALSFFLRSPSPTLRGGWPLTWCAYRFWQQSRGRYLWADHQQARSPVSVGAGSSPPHNPWKSAQPSARRICYQTPLTLNQSNNKKEKKRKTKGKALIITRYLLHVQFIVKVLDFLHILWALLPIVFLYRSDPSKHQVQIIPSFFCLLFSLSPVIFLLLILTSYFQIHSSTNTHTHTHARTDTKMNAWMKYRAMCTNYSGCGRSSLNTR